MTRRFDGVAWDIDGTLADSEPLHLRCLIEVCDGFSLNLRNEPKDRFLGTHMHDVWRALAPDLPVGLTRAAFLAGIDEAYAAGVGGLQPIPYALEIIDTLAAGGIMQVAVSNSGRRVVDANLSALGLTGYFAATISLNDVSAGKPDPEPYARGASALDLPPGRLLAVEDTQTGATSAIAAGLSLALLGGSGPDGISDLREVLRLVLLPD